MNNFINNLSLMNEQSMLYHLNHIKHTEIEQTLLRTRLKDIFLKRKAENDNNILQEKLIEQNKFIHKLMHKNKLLEQNNEHLLKLLNDINNKSNDNYNTEKQIESQDDNNDVINKLERIKFLMNKKNINN